MNKKHSLLITCLLNLFFYANSQKLDVDSMRTVIQTTKDDSIRIYSMTKLANYLLNHSMETQAGMRLIDSAEKLAIEKKHFLLNIQVKNVKGNYFTYNNDWNKAIEAFKQSLAEVDLLADSVQRMKVRMKLLSNLGNIHILMGDFSTALDYHLQSLSIVETIKPLEYNSLATVYINIATDYYSLNLDSKMEEYLKRLDKIDDSIGTALRLNKLSLEYDLYARQKSTQKISLLINKLNYLLNKNELSKTQELDGQYMLYYMKGDYAAMDANKYDSAVSYYKTSLRYAAELQDDRKKGYVYYKLGNAYMQLKALKEAISNLENGLLLSNERDLADQKMNITNLLGDANYQLKNYKKAADYYITAKLLSDSIYNDKKTKELNYLEAKYQNQKRENEIARLTLSNIEKELAVVKRNRLLLFGGISAVALLVILGLFVRSNRQKRLLAEKDSEVQQQHIQFLEKQQQIVSMQSMINGQETERTRIAKDLHDGLGGLFSTIKMQMSTLKHEEKNLKENQLFQKSYELVDTASTEVRRIAHNMMPEVLMKLGLVHAVQDLCSNISAGKLLQVTMQSYGMQQRLNASTEIMLYRIIQELLNNIIKHAKATEAIVQFNRQGDRLHVTVEDNGLGFNLKEVDEKNHAGLETIRSRVNYLNGNISIDSEKGTGTTIMMEFLINEQA